MIAPPLPPPCLDPPPRPPPNVPHPYLPALPMPPFISYRGYLYSRWVTDAYYSCADETLIFFAHASVVHTLHVQDTRHAHCAPALAARLSRPLLPPLPAPPPACDPFSKCLLVPPTLTPRQPVPIDPPSQIPFDPARSSSLFPAASPPPFLFRFSFPLVLRGRFSSPLLSLSRLEAHVNSLSDYTFNVTVWFGLDAPAPLAVTFWLHPAPVNLFTYEYRPQLPLALSPHPRSSCLIPKTDCFSRLHLSLRPASPRRPTPVPLEAEDVNLPGVWTRTGRRATFERAR